jgi:preprotein translocase subunit YajC
MILLQNITTATTGAPAPIPGAAQGPASPGLWSSLLPFIVVVPIFFMMFRRNKKEEEARESLKKGDKVLVGGLVGELVEIEGKLAKVKVANGVVLTAVRTSLSPFESTPSEDPLKDLKEAKADTK